MSNTARKTAFYGMVTALGMVLSYVETLLPVYPGVPGVKPGLANIVVLLCLNRPYGSLRKNLPGAFLCGLTRILLSGFLFGNLFAIAYSLSGFFLSLAVEGLLAGISESPKTKVRFGVVSVSAAGGVAHNLGQLITAYFLCGKTVLLYLPWLILFGVGAGLLTGIPGAILIGRTEKVLPECS